MPFFLRKKTSGDSPTFRSRLAIHLVLLISGAVTLTFSVTLGIIHLFAENDELRHLEQTAREVRDAYLGKQVPPKQRVQLPEHLYRRITHRFPDLRLGLVEKERGKRGWVYEMLGSTGTEQLEILAEENGPIWIADRIPVAELVNRMDRQLREELPGAVLALYAPDGHLIGRSAGSFSLPPFRKLPFSPPSEDLDDGRFIRRGTDRLALIRLYDDNLLLILRPDTLSPRLMRYGLLFLLLSLAFFIPLAAWIGRYIARRAMSGVERVTRAARHVEAGCFTERVDRGREGREIEELADAFNDMVARIDQLMRELRDMSVNIAHDLRTPLARIRGTLENVDWEELSPEQRREQLATAIEECDRLATLVDDILELAQAESGVLGLHCETFDLREEVKRIAGLFSALVEEKGLHFSVDLPDAPILLTADRRRIQRVLANLIDNAVKYTPSGGRIAVILQRDEDAAHLEVRDTGPGIPASERERVFERFYRGIPGRHLPGNGLGLNLVKAFVELHGGSVELDCIEGQGCIVRIRLPLHPS